MSQSTVLETPLARAREKGGRQLMSRWAHIVKIWIVRWLGRRELRSLDEGTLKDVGISRADVFREADKAFWRP